MSRIKIAPSLLAADFSELEREVERVQNADYLHLDIMDGCFVPNISFGPLVLHALRDKTGLVFDTHLMIARPGEYIEMFAEAGSQVLTIHTETTVHLHRLLQRIKKLGVKAGVSLNPATPVGSLECVLHLIDHLLFMSVNPGFGGQKFLPEVLPKIEAAASWRDEHNLKFDIAVDGGIDPDTAPQVVQAGADILVAGSAVFGAECPGEMIESLRGASE